MTTAQQDRTINLEIELDAPIETVWKALTEADRLKSWFPYDARVEPGVGGSIWLSWGPECEGEAPITIWDPPNRIQQTEHRGPWGGDDSIGPVDITVDYHLESRSGGGTVLRLVQAGIGPEPEWDGEYHATAEDWPMFLQILAHYVANHDGIVRQVTNIASSFDISASEVWSKLFGNSAVDEIRAGAPYAIKIAGALAAHGVVRLVEHGRRLVGTLDDLNDAIFVLTNHPKPDDASMVTVELSTYGVTAEDIGVAKEAWEEALGAVEL